jgi:adenylosuccinate lyase
MKLVKRGADRQRMHERLRQYSVHSWSRVLQGERNPLPDMLKNDRAIRHLLKLREIDALLDISEYVGDAPRRCKMFVDKTINPLLQKYDHLLTGKSEVEF